MRNFPKMNPEQKDKWMAKMLYLYSQGMGHREIYETLKKDGFNYSERGYFRLWKRTRVTVAEESHEETKDVIARILMQRRALFREAKSRHAKSIQGVEALAVANRILESETKFLQDLGLLPSDAKAVVQVQNNVAVVTMNSWIKKKAMQYVEPVESGTPNQG